jgi:hypothetical protein
MMGSSLSDRLIDATTVDLDAPSAVAGALRYCATVLRAHPAHLPARVLEWLPELANGSAAPTPRQAEDIRCVLWQGLAEDQMGETPRGAALRAAIFAFSDWPSDEVHDGIAMFIDFASMAGIPAHTLADTFLAAWPDSAAAARDAPPLA